MTTKVVEVEGIIDKINSLLMNMKQIIENSCNIDSIKSNTVKSINDSTIKSNIDDTLVYTGADDNLTLKLSKIQINTKGPPNNSHTNDILNSNINLKDVLIRNKDLGTVDIIEDELKTVKEFLHIESEVYDISCYYSFNELTGILLIYDEVEDVIIITDLYLRGRKYLDAKLTKTQIEYSTGMEQTYDNIADVIDGSRTHLNLITIFKSLLNFNQSDIVNMKDKIISFYTMASTWNFNLLSNPTLICFGGASLLVQTSNILNIIDLCLKVDDIGIIFKYGGYSIHLLLERTRRHIGLDAFTDNPDNPKQINIRRMTDIFY